MYLWVLFLIWYSIFSFLFNIIKLILKFLILFNLKIIVTDIATERKVVHYNHVEGEVSQVEWVRALWIWGIFLQQYPNLHGDFDLQQIECSLVIGLWCANPDKVSDEGACLKLLYQFCPKRSHASLLHSNNLSGIFFFSCTRPVSYSQSNETLCPIIIMCAFIKNVCVYENIEL